MASLKKAAAIDATIDASFWTRPLHGSPPGAGRSSSEISSDCVNAATAPVRSTSRWAVTSIARVIRPSKGRCIFAVSVLKQHPSRRSTNGASGETCRSHFCSIALTFEERPLNSEALVAASSAGSRRARAASGRRIPWRCR